MNINIRELILRSLAVAASITFGATSSLAQVVDTVYPADYQEIVEASKSEGTVLIYQNMNSDVWAEVKSGFEAKYPWISVQTLDLESGEVIERYRAEKGAGRPTGDLLVTVAPDLWIGLHESGEIIPYESPEGAAYEDWSKPFPGVYTMITDPMIFLYNKLALPPELVPTGMADLVAKAQANPEVFSGRITTAAAHLNSFFYAVQYAMQDYHGEKLWDWYEILGPMTRPENGTGPMTEKVASGEYVLAFLTGSATSWVTARAPGGDQLVGWSFIDDGTPIIPRVMAVPQGATNPNAAKLMLDYILSREGQIAFAQTRRTVVRPDVLSTDVGGEYTYASVAAEIGADKMINVPNKPELLTDYEAFIERWKAVFGG